MAITKAPALISEQSASTDSNAPQLRILCLASSIGGNITKIRLTTPLSEWVARYGGTVHAKAFYELSPEDAFAHDVIIVQRECPAHVAQFLRLAKKYGRRIVFEIDDLLTEIPEFLSHHQLGKKQRARLEWVLQFAHAVSVSTPRLAEKIRIYNPNIFITQNYFAPLITQLNRTVPPRPLETESSAPINLILASSDTITLKFITPALQQLSSENSDDIRIVCIGPIGQTIKSHGIPCTSEGILPYEHFYSYIRAIPNAVGIIPLDTSEFSFCKSAVKYFDYAASRIPTICSNTPPYSDVIENEKTGILVENTTESWKAAIETLRSPKIRNQIAQAALEHVSTNFSISHNIEAWSILFSTISSDMLNSEHKSYTQPTSIDVLTYKYLMFRSHLRILNRKRLQATKRFRAKNS